MWINGKPDEATQSKIDNPEPSQYIPKSELNNNVPGPTLEIKQISVVNPQ